MGYNHNADLYAGGYETAYQTCDIPGCDGPRAIVSPDGYVCYDCASEIVAEHSKL